MPQLRDYQQNNMVIPARHALRTSKGVVVVGATGSGKTSCAAYMARGAVERGKRVLVIVHKQETHGQMMETLHHWGVATGQIFAGKHMTRERCQVAMVQTLSNRIDIIPYDFDMVIVDECFPAGTKIKTITGDKCIEKIKPGELVYTVSDDMVVELKQVQKLIKKPLVKNIAIIKAGRNKITCTEDHKIFTKSKGWTEANKIKPGDLVLQVTEVDGGNNEMLHMRKNNLQKGHKPRYMVLLQKKWTRLLFKEMLKRILPSNIIRDNGKDKPEICIRENEEKQSDEQPANTSKNEEDIKKDWTQAKDARRKWQGAYKTTRIISNYFRLKNRTRNTNKNKKRQWISDLLQSRSCDSRDKTCYRNRREFSPIDRKTKAGQEKRKSIEWLRVDSVKVQEQRGRRKYNKLHKENYVYDLTIEKNHNYFANTILVHNCHHCLESNRWGRVLKHPRIKNTAHILFTATPQGRTNGAGLHPFADQIVQGVSTLQLIEDGWLVYPRIYKPDKEVTDNFKITRGDYDTKQQEEVFSRKKVVGDAFDHYHYYLNGAPQITACVSLRHAHETMEYYREQARAHKKDWTIAMIQGGKKHEAQRRDAIAGLASGSVQVIMFVDVLGEGVDVPVCVGLQWIRKTTSLVNYLQFTGRILRPLFPPGFNQYASTREQRIDAIRRSPKPYGVILDHAGNYYTHGHPVIERTWGLDDTRTGRAVEQSAPVITTCPVCNSVWPGKPSKCPACGAVIEEERDGSRRNPEVIKGMLREVVDLEGDDLDRLARFTQNLDGMTEEERRKKMLGALRYIDRDRMRAVAGAVGYKKNWTDTMYRRLNIKAPAGGKR